jgi:nucleotide-binding universal stress UspA family protein
MAIEAIDRSASVFATSALDAGGNSALLALDGTAQCDGALALASWLANNRSMSVHVISVVEPSCTRIADELSIDELTDLCAARRHSILGQIDGEDPYEAPWPVTVVPGSPVTLIADTANSASFDLLIVGLPRRSDATMLRADNALRIARRVNTPLVAVAHSLRVPPRSCVAGIDFTRSSLRAARAASTLLAPGGTLFLAHVQPDLEDGEDNLKTFYSQGILGAFDRLTYDLGARPDIHLKCLLLEGHPRTELPTFCDRVDADLLAVGTSQVDAAYLNRAHLSSSFIRASTRSVLIAPAVPRSSGARYWDD